jgi:hypothetical protein
MIRHRIKKAKRFVTEHQMLVACGITAAITYKFTNDKKLSGEIRKAIRYANEIGYLEGLEVDDFNKALDKAYDFIKEQGLEPEFADYSHMTLVKVK